MPFTTLWESHLGVWKGLNNNVVLNRTKILSIIVGVGGIVGNIGVNEVALSPCYLPVPSLWSSAWWGWLESSSLDKMLCCGIRSLHVYEGSRKYVKVCLRGYEQEDRPQCQTCVCVNMCAAVILQCARGKVLLELGRLKAASWISSRRTSQGSQVCSPRPTPCRASLPRLINQESSMPNSNPIDSAW